jgi:ribosome-associated heat shock protein Hsp15
MLIDKDIRVDKWLWAVRIFKTRSAASTACRTGKVLVNNSPVKPSRIIKINDVVSVRRQSVLFSYKVRGLLGKRMSARLVKDYVDNITPESELDKLKLADTFFIRRDKGAGRPTKKERRTIDKIRRRMN